MNESKSLESLCLLFGHSRQAYYQRVRYNYKQFISQEIILQVVQKKRKLMPKIGGRKIYTLLRQELPEELIIGRDSLFDLLRDNGLLVKKRKIRAVTTNSHHWLRKYPNLIVGFNPTSANQIWVSDITYVITKDGFKYLSLITDAYSRKIIGWELADSLEAIHSLKALKMAIKQLPKGVKDVYHHSDRGVQYCSDMYVKELKRHNFLISMTESGDPRDNAIAERVNGILKDEWINDMSFISIKDAKKMISRVIRTYNGDRPHLSINMFTPNQAHLHKGKLERKWKNYWRYNYQKINIEAMCCKLENQQVI